MITSIAVQIVLVATGFADLVALLLMVNGCIALLLESDVSEDGGEQLMLSGMNERSQRVSSEGADCVNGLLPGSKHWAPVSELGTQERGQEDLFVHRCDPSPFHERIEIAFTDPDSAADFAVGEFATPEQVSGRISGDIERLR